MATLEIGRTRAGGPVARIATGESGSAATAPTTPSATRRREPRLDFFRGIAMLIILIAHIPSNPWGEWIPARFGPSDAAEMFVFCSGFAAALAFGGTFIRAGFWLGVARIVQRCWQVYWAHIGLFFTVALILAGANMIFGTERMDYLTRINIHHFFDDTATNLVGLMTLTYIPNYFDILPMYLVILAMVPIVMALQKIDTRLAGAFCVLVWLGAQVDLLNLPAEPWSDRTWFFNPFGWQLLFFTAFFYARGWIRPPPFRRDLILIASIMAFGWIAIYHPGIYAAAGEGGILWDLNTAIFYEVNHKTDQSLLRYLHILALAYLALAFFDKRGHWLEMAWAQPIIMVGQQALATFMSSMALAWVIGITLDQVGYSALTVTLANLVGLAIIIAIAYLVSWYKSEPWRPPRPRPQAASAS